MREGMTLSLEDIERLNRQSQDLVVKRRNELGPILGDPVLDLELFHMHAPGKRILDVGCGWGRYVHRFLDLGFEYCGIDLSFEMIRAAREINHGLPFVQMSFRNLAFLDGHFDAIWCCCVLSCEPKKNIQNVLRELRRVLRPNGVLFVVLHDYHTSEEDTTLSGAEMERGHFSLWLPKEFEQELTTAGFVVEHAIRRAEDASMTFVVSNYICDCQNPPPDGYDAEEGVYHVSNECPVHNWNPYSPPQ